MGSLHARCMVLWRLWMALYWIQAVHCGLLTSDYSITEQFSCCQEIASYDDVWIVPIEAGLDYMKTIAFGANLSNEQLKAQGKDNGPFACKDIEEKTGKYDKSFNRCGPSKSCRLLNIILLSLNQPRSSGSQM